ncbi:hypothetical protein [Flavobacterium flavigenum]|uniref:hypothetical protein n=1 Tax=Flavobacterium flavigenum TaxID=3003258 RepID=UPI0022AC8E1B|nr:hypothetical protein [Flavobacterium flavigenum]
MATIYIPEEVKEGFILISEMNLNDVNSLVKILADIRAGDEYDSIIQRLNEVFENKSRILLQTVVSFSGLIGKDDATVEEVAKNLAESFIQDYQKSKEEEVALEKNLNIILSNVANLRKNIVSRRSAYDNESILRSSKLITDLRILFQDDLSNKNRDAVIIHKLHVEYQHNFSDKELYFTLDLKDLNRLKAEIEKAIEKDQIIREDYKNNLNILF